MKYLFLVVTLLISIVNSADNNVYVATIWDQYPGYNPSFEYNSNNYGLRTGMVQSKLVNKLPSLSQNANSNPSNFFIQKPSNFITFWKSDPATNMETKYNLTLSKDPSTGYYTYSNPNFYPIDNQLLDLLNANNKSWVRYSDGSGNYHNYHFCMAVHQQFTYTNQQIFKFSGDDDVFVFLNNTLAIDIGGIHSKQNAQVNITQFAIQNNFTKGDNCDFDFYFCERHTVESNFFITTDLKVFCEAYDFCGECNGDGKSCCNATFCDDHNSCTTDSCPPASTPKDSWKCIHEQNTQVTDKCHVLDGTGSTCLLNPIDCDNSPSRPAGCYASSCNATTGCTFTPNCFGNDKCKSYSCEGNNCLITSKVCPPKPCYSVSCESTSGDCIYTPTCSAVSSCSCVGNICQNPNCVWDSTCSTQPTLPANCGTANATCDHPWTETSHCMTETCENGKIRSQSSCGNTTNCELHQCVNGTCSVTNRCDDHNLCTADTCTGDKCFNTPISCDDNDPCTVDSCNYDSGCTHTPVDCSNPLDVCNTYSCGSNGTCVPTPIECPSKPCYTSKCDAVKGCIYQEKSCHDASDCQYTYCDESTGKCEYKDLDPLPFKCDSKAKAAVISSAAVAGIVIGAAAALAFMAYGGKKGYDYWKSSRGNTMSNVNNNPLFEDKPTQKDNPLFTSNNA